MPAPALVRLWPSFIAAPVRAWLLANLKGGMVDSGTATVNLDRQRSRPMRAQRSVPDDHVRVDLRCPTWRSAFMPGVPALAGVDGTGRSPGDTANFTVQHGEHGGFARPQADACRRHLQGRRHRPQADARR